MGAEPVVKVLGFSVTALSMSETLDSAMMLVDKGRGQIVTANAEILFRATRDAALAAVLNDADIVTPDGMGVVMAAWLLGTPLAERVSGADLLPALCQRLEARGQSIFLLGAAPGVAEKASAELRRRFPALAIAGVHHGFFGTDEDSTVISLVRESGAAFLAVGLGARQECWIHQYSRDLNCPAMGVGGSLDILAGTARRAPAWMQKWGLEWLYRLLREPRRIVRMSALPRFAAAVLMERVKSGR